MLRELQVGQRKPRAIVLRVQGTGTAAILEGGLSDASLVDNGAGDWTITFGAAFVRVPAVMLQSATTGVLFEIGSVSKTSVQVLGFDVATGAVATDGDFHLVAVGYDAADEI